MKFRYDDNKTSKDRRKLYFKSNVALRIVTDSAVAFNAYKKVTSSNKKIADMVAEASQMLTKLGVSVMLEYVWTKINPADIPTRYDNRSNKYKGRQLNFVDNIS